ncbi:hypothetical protein D3C87_835230 [compost metagenome]
MRSVEIHLTPQSVAFVRLLHSLVLVQNRRIRFPLVYPKLQLSFGVLRVVLARVKQTAVTVVSLVLKSQLKKAKFLRSTLVESQRLVQVVVVLKSSVMVRRSS